MTLIRQAGDSGQLYGSVKAGDIAEAVVDGGFTIARQQVELHNPIKSLGIFEVKVDLHPEVSVNIMANIARTEEEANIQLKTGKAVVSAEEEAKAADAEAAEASEKAAAAKAAKEEAADAEAAEDKTEAEAAEGDAEGADDAAEAEGEKEEKAD